MKTHSEQCIVKILENEARKRLLLLIAVLLFMGNTSCAIFNPVDNYLIACGSYQNISSEGRTFVPDSQHPSVLLESASSAVAGINSSGISPVYRSARFFTGLASYQFHIKQKGWHWIRLYFHPFGPSLASVSITVVAETFLLLHNFSFKSYSTSFMFKEYAINVNSKKFTLTFVPSEDSTVFVNAIEVVSIPNEVFSFPVQHRRKSFPSSGISSLALETMYRLNMGESSVTAQNDTLYRIWEEDEEYLQASLPAADVSVDPVSIKSSFDITAAIAPNQVYATAKALKNARTSNLTWIFSVNPNFTYFLRMHFCDIISKFRSELYFDVYINSAIVLEDLDLSALTYDVRVPYYIDFVSESSRDSDVLTVRIEKSNLEHSHNATMNGLEIFKVSNELRSLDGLSSVEDILPKASSKTRNIAIALSSVVSVCVLLALVGLIYSYMVANKSKRTSQNNGSAGELSLASHGVCRIFTFQEIKDATNNFGEDCLIGIGGFGKVYLGKLDDGTKVAFKRANPQSKQGLTEFQNEIGLLSKLHHRHLVSLIGCCNEGAEMILVYEYMENGSFSKHLYGPNVAPLSWKQRLEICIGSARGLHYLHTGAAHSVIHRDVKTANILLDENFIAKVSDFGISRKGPPLYKSHVSTAVKGSFGYFDPEYFRSRHLTEKSDVYSFGVVLIEALCGRPALDHSLPPHQINLAGWALSCEANGVLHQIIDPSLFGKVKFASLNMVWEVAKKCLAEHRINRPTMGYVMRSLEDALHLDLRNDDDTVDSNVIHSMQGDATGENFQPSHSTEYSVLLPLK